MQIYTKSFLPCKRVCLTFSFRLEVYTEKFRCTRSSIRNIMYSVAYFCEIKILYSHTTIDLPDKDSACDTQFFLRGHTKNLDMFLPMSNNFKKYVFSFVLRLKKKKFSYVKWYVNRLWIIYWVTQKIKIVNLMNGKR